MTGVIILGVVIVTMLVEPQLKARKSQRAQLGELKLQWARMTGNVQVKNRIEEAYGRVESLIASAGNDQQEISIFTRDLSALHAGLNIRTKSMKILPTQHEEYHRVLSIRIEVEGTIGEIVRFILALEAHPKPLCLEQFVLKAQEVTDSVHGSFLVTKIVSRREG